MNIFQLTGEKIRGIAREPESSQILIAGIVISLNLILVAPRLMPAFAEINPHDEAKYIESGARLLDFQLRGQAWGPLVAVPYALLHLLIGKSANWFMLEAWGGRYLFFVGMWISTLFLAVRVGSRSLLLIAAGVLFVSFYFIRILPNQSDALFVILSALALAELISFLNTHRFRDVWLGSVFTALAALTRTEAILLVPLFAAMVMILGWRKLPLSRLAAAATIPAVIVLGAFALVSIASGNSLGSGVGSKAYASFEWNQSILTGGDLVEAKRQTDQLFGTQEENEGSILRAISRNPGAFIERIVANFKTLPGDYLDAFGKRLGLYMLLFAAVGSLVLLRTGSATVLGIMAIWALQPFVALGFLATHIIPQIGFIILLLAGIGVYDAFGSNRLNVPKWGYILLAVLIAAYALLDQKPAFLPGALLLAAVGGISWIVEKSLQPKRIVKIISLMLVLGAGLILRGPFSFPNFPQLGTSSGERAVLAIEERLHAGSRVVVEYPGLAIAARMEPIDLANFQSEVESGIPFCEIIARHEIAAFYIPSHIAQNENALWQMIMSSEGECVGSPVIFDPGSIQVVFTNE